MSFGEVQTSILRNYPQYRLEDFRKSYQSGGLTLGQVIVMFKHADQEEFNRLKIQAKLHGCTFDEDNANDGQGGDDDAPIFKDPSAYAHMSDEEKEQLTQSMMCDMKKWAGQVGM